MKRIYLAGPYSSDNVIGVLNNIGIGIKKASEILKGGDAVFCPFLGFHYQILDQTLTKEDYYRVSMAWLEVSDEVWVLENWEGSTGTQKEIERANELNIPVKFLGDVKNDGMLQEIHEVEEFHDIDPENNQSLV